MRAPLCHTFPPILDSTLLRTLNRRRIDAARTLSKWWKVRRHALVVATSELLKNSLREGHELNRTGSVESSGNLVDADGDDVPAPTVPAAPSPASASPTSARPRRTGSKDKIEVQHHDYWQEKQRKEEERLRDPCAR